MKVVSGKPKTELQKFASWFHQDLKLVYANFHEGALVYFDALPEERKERLRIELGDFLRAHSGPSGLRRSWMKLGAQAWPADLDIKVGLRTFLSMI